MKDHKEALQNNFDFLRDSLEPESLADFLFTKGKFTKADQESISLKRENKGRTAASRTCLDILIKSGPDTFECFKEFLRSHCSRYFILEKLEKDMVEEIRVVMFGKTGVGKSVLGNNILGHKTFDTAVCAQSVTNHITRGERMLDTNCKLVLVDTPGLYDTSAKDHLKTARILARIVKETKPGPHIFIFVLAIGRFTMEEKATVEFLKDYFGSQVSDYLLIVFTGKDSLDFDKISLNTYIKGADKELKSIVSQCQETLAINNRASDEEVTESVDSLLQMIQGVYLKNNKKHYTDELLAEAQTTFDEKLREQEEEAHRRKRELEEETRTLKEKYKAQSKQFNVQQTKLQHQIRQLNEEKHGIERVLTDSMNSKITMIVVNEKENQLQIQKLQTEMNTLTTEKNSQLLKIEERLQIVESQHKEYVNRLKEMGDQNNNNTKLIIKHFDERFSEVEAREKKRIKCTIQ